MNGYQRFPVSPSLRPYVREAWIQDASITANEPPVYCVFPTPYPVMGFQYRGRLHSVCAGARDMLGRSGITGLQERVRHFVADADTATILVMLEPHAGFPLFGHAMHELANEHPPLDVLAPSRLVREVEERVARAPSARGRIAVVEEFLSDLVRRSRREAHPSVVQAVRRILAGGGREPVQSLSADVSLSRRQLERLFLREVGVSPKEFSSLVQFDKAVQSMPDYASSAAQALDAGFADQAHFVRSFSRRAGIAPGRFRRGGRPA